MISAAARAGARRAGTGNQPFAGPRITPLPPLTQTTARQQGTSRSIDSLTMNTAHPMPPDAKRIPVERTHHGDRVIDEYAWLADKQNPDTIAFLEAENAYTDEMKSAQGPF